jgi:6-phosphogluconate dehydrogenase
MATGKFRLGMIGLGTMGRNLLLNLADHGFDVAGHDKDPNKITLLEKEGAGKNVKGFLSVKDLIESLEVPRVIILLVPAGKIVDAVINELHPLLSKGDIIIDAGNSHFTDTTERVIRLEKSGLHFFGMGISGGEEGARKGPSMMPGGDITAYTYLQPVFEAIAARVNGEPCVAYIGPGASGHFVKMVHNGIEYALMQLIADTYMVLKNYLQLNNEKIAMIFAKWNKGRLQSYLLEITATIFAYKNPDGTYLVDEIKDEAKSKGTGKWTTQISTDLELPIHTIDLAVAMRDLSKYKSLREKTAITYPPKNKLSSVDGEVWINKLKNAYYFSMIIIYAQGMHLLSKASAVYAYNLKPDEISKIWRGGCIIRAALLENMYQAYRSNPQLEHLLLDNDIRALIKSSVDSAREVVVKLTEEAISIPAYTSALSYFDAIRTGSMPSNLIQAQRDLFGAHTYELIGKEGVFHTDWIKPVA